MREVADQTSVRVIQVGPDLAVRGGVSAVEKLIVEYAGRHVAIEQLVTMADGSGVRKALVFARALLRMRVLLKQRGARVFHIHFSKRGSTLRKIVLARMAMHRGYPVVLHAHSGAYAAFLDGLPTFMRNAVCDTLRRADRLIVLSSQWRDFYMGACGVDSAKIPVMRNPTRMPRELPQRTGRSAIQFLFLGRISNAKGAFDLLDAFAQLQCADPAQVRLVFAGDGEVERMRALAASFGERVRVFSWIDTEQRDRLLQESDVFVLPSYAEGMPMSLLEAMAFALPAITTAVGGIPDVVSNEVEGVLVEPGRIDSLLRAMQQMLDNPDRRLQLGARARLRAEEFDVQRYAQELVQMYREVLDARSTSRGSLVRPGGLTSAVETSDPVN
jgi:glycosyltransferase involved in cell wall biosynthesis